VKGKSGRVKRGEDYTRGITGRGIIEGISQRGRDNRWRGYNWPVSCDTWCTLERISLPRIISVYQRYISKLTQYSSPAFCRLNIADTFLPI
jgi:hypothetical protein